jgi:hypothetical protein
MTTTTFAITNTAALAAGILPCEFCDCDARVVVREMGRAQIDNIELGGQLPGTKGLR